MARRFLPNVDRRETRFPYQTKIRFRAFGLTFSGETLDVSAHGVYISTDYEVDRETPIELVFALQEDKGAIVQSRGRVAWVNSGKERKKPGYPVGFGIEMTAITEESKRVLNLFMDNLDRQMRK
jgi:hypothetical protein